MSIQRAFGVIGVVALAATVAFAGKPTASPSAASPDMEAMMADMAKCHVCKHMAAHMDELAPVMTMDVVTLNDGVAVLHHIHGEKQLATFRTAYAEMGKAGAECMTMTDEQAKAQLCGYCQEVRAVVMGGGNMSTGETADGDMMVLTAKDEASQKRIANVTSMCKMAAGS